MRTDTPCQKRKRRIDPQLMEKILEALIEGKAALAVHEPATKNSTQNN